MRIVRIKDVKDDTVFQRMETLDEVNLTDWEERNTIFEACKGDINIITEWFNTIGIKYDSIEIRNNKIHYIINNIELDLFDLSHGERMLLYLIACKQFNKKVAIKGLFERLGTRLTNVVAETLLDYENLIIVLYNVNLDDCFEKYMVEEL
jgi:hypothetical protein